MNYEIFNLEETSPPVRNLIKRSSRRCGRVAELIQLTVGIALLGLAHFIHAQCPQICDSNGNTALGNALITNTTGVDNTATGDTALFANTTGNDNTAIGYESLISNTTGFQNTAVGVAALFSNTTGNSNTAVGLNALLDNTTGNYNTANGETSLLNNTTGFNNTANGYGALYSNTTGATNMAIGANALFSNATGSNNAACGYQALFSNTMGHDNIAGGFNALENNTIGSSNIALGSDAGVNLTTGSNNIDIGNAGVVGESNHIRIGTKPTQKNTFIAGISGVVIAAGAGVIIGTDGHLGTVMSSARFKDDIQPMEKASEAILALKPVTFRYKHDLDPKGIPQFGLVAEEVEKVNPDLVARDDEGKPYTVRYEAVNAMLLNEFLKEHRKVEEQGAMIARQQKQIEALIAGLQKMSAQLKVGKPAPQTVLNSQ